MRPKGLNYKLYLRPVWPYSLFKISRKVFQNRQHWKFAQKLKKFAKVGSKFSQILNKFWKKLPWTCQIRQSLTLVDDLILMNECSECVSYSYSELLVKMIWLHRYFSCYNAMAATTYSPKAFLTLISLNI